MGFNAQVLGQIEPRHYLTCVPEVPFDVAGLYAGTGQLQAVADDRSVL